MARLESSKFLFAGFVGRIKALSVDHVRMGAVRNDRIKNLRVKFGETADAELGYLPSATGRRCVDVRGRESVYPAHMAPLVRGRAMYVEDAGANTCAALRPRAHSRPNNRSV